MDDTTVRGLELALKSLDNAMKMCKAISGGRMQKARDHIVLASLNISEEIVDIEAQQPTFVGDERRTK